MPIGTTYADPQDPYSIYGEGTQNQPESKALSFSIQEQPEYLKALQKQGATYDPYSNTLTRSMGTPSEAFQKAQGQQAQQGTAITTGDRPWLNEPGFLSMSPEQQAQFSSLMEDMEAQWMGAAAHRQRDEAAQRGRTIGQSPAAGGQLDIWQSPQWEQWYPKQVELEDKWSWMLPTYEQRSETGALTGYQTIQGAYDYLQPGQYAKAKDQSGQDVYYFKDPTGTEKGLRMDYIPPEGFYDVDMVDLYSVAEMSKATNPMNVWGEYTQAKAEQEAYNRYPEIPGLGSQSTDIQNQISPYVQQISDLQTKISGLQNMRPEERLAQESSTGQSLTSYLANLQDVQKQVGAALVDTTVVAPQFNPITGKKITPELTEYEESINQQRALRDSLAQPYMTGITPNQQLNSTALQILMQYGNPYGTPYYNQVGAAPAGTSVAAPGDGLAQPYGTGITPEMRLQYGFVPGTPEYNQWAAENRRRAYASGLIPNP